MESAVLAGVAGPILQEHLTAFAVHIGAVGLVGLGSVFAPNVRVEPIWDNETKQWNFTHIKTDNNSVLPEANPDANADSSEVANSGVVPKDNPKHKIDTIANWVEEIIADPTKMTIELAKQFLTHVVNHTGVDSVIVAYEMFILGKTLQEAPQATSLMIVPTLNETLKKIQNFFIEIIPQFSIKIPLFKDATKTISLIPKFDSADIIEALSDRFKPVFEKIKPGEKFDNASITEKLTNAPPLSIKNNPTSQGEPTTSEQDQEVPDDGGDKSEKHKEGSFKKIRDYLFSPLLIPTINIGTAAVMTAISDDEYDTADESSETDKKDDENVYYKVTINLCLDNTTPKQVLFDESYASTNLNGGGFSLHPNTTFYLPSDPTANTAEQNYPPISTSEFQKIPISPSSFIENNKHRFDRVYVLHRYNTTIWGRLYNQITKVNVKNVLIVAQVGSSYMFCEVERNKGKENELFAHHDKIVDAFPEIATKITELNQDVQVAEFPDTIYITTTLRVWNILPQTTKFGRFFYLLWRHYKTSNRNAPPKKLWCFDLNGLQLNMDDKSIIRLQLQKNHSSEEISKVQSQLNSSYPINPDRTRTNVTIDFQYAEYIEITDHMNLCPVNLYSYDYIINTTDVLGDLKIKKFEDLSDTQPESTPGGSG